MASGGEGGGERRCSDGGEACSLSVEQIFECKEVPGWREQLTFRSLVVSLVLGVFLSVIVMKLSLTSGIIPSLNVSAGLLSFFFIRTWTKISETAGFVVHPFTRQENTVIQTSVVACSSIAFSGGFGSNLLGMSTKVAKEFNEANTDINTKDPSLGWVMLFLFTVSFAGLFSVVPLRKIMIIRHNLTYPTGTATAHLINSFHTPQGANIARRQVLVLTKSFGASFVWSMFKWLYTAGPQCGFDSFPIFGLKAFQNRFYFDFSATYIGVGMMCPHMINISLLLGSILSWGILWPYIASKKGIWYDADLPNGSLRGLTGYKVFISIAMILGDGLYHFVSVLFQSLHDMYTRRSFTVPLADDASLEAAAMSYDDRRRTKVFLQDQIPTRVAVACYLALTASSVATVPLIFPQLQPLHILAAYLVAPLLAYSNAYGCGLTDWSLASSYGKLAIFVFGGWVGMGGGGVLAGLAACGVVMSVVATASDLMQDFKTGYLTLASPRAMFVSQAVGTAIGCVVGPVVFWLFDSAFPVGDEGSEYPAPYARVYRGIALLGVEGAAALPKYCVGLCAGFFAAAVGLNVLREVAGRRRWAASAYVPSAMGMAVPFYLGSYFAVDMCVGGAAVWAWRRVDERHAAVFATAVASGMMCGDGIWSLPESLLMLAKVTPPICMKFLSGTENAKVDAFLGRR